MLGIVSALVAIGLYILRLKTAGPASLPFVKVAASGPEGTPEAAEGVAASEEAAPEMVQSGPECPAEEDAEAENIKEETDHVGENH